MDKKKEWSKFNTLQRVSRKQVDWVVENKEQIGGKTIAECLDIIINSYKNK